jgi:hypothetical protein
LIRLTLYGTAGCHLCEAAEEVLREVLAEREFEAQPKLVDIAGDGALLERYGLRIPVLRNEDSGTEIGWPFDAAGLRDFLP